MEGKASPHDLARRKKPSFHVVLVEPEIPPNTGNIGRLCLATGARLHLVEPLGFSIDDRTLRRAGLDYWKQVDWCTWPSWDAFWEGRSKDDRNFFFTTKSSQCYWDIEFEIGDFLIFGRETKGLPESLLDAHVDHCFRIPMEGTRSLNLATAVGIVLYEGMRQVRY